MVIPAAVGILTLGSLANRRKGLAVIFSAVLVLGFVSVTHPNFEGRERIAMGPSPRIALLPSEVAAAQTITNNTEVGWYRRILPMPDLHISIQLLECHCVPPLSAMSGFSDNNSSWVVRLEIANNPYIASNGPVSKLGAGAYESLKLPKT